MSPVTKVNKQEMSLEPTSWSGRAWARVLLAGVAVHLVGIVATAVLVPVYVILAGATSAEGFAGLLSTASLPVLTLPAAARAARGARAGSDPLVGLAVGLLVASLLGVLFFWPYDPRSVALFALIVAAGLGGGLLRGAEPRFRR
jgi:hypothetical protein